MKREFTRKELYDLVWAQPMRTVAASIGISDVALAKHCKKAEIPVPRRGYWARHDAGKPTVRVALPARFPGASDRVGGADKHHYYYGEDWPQKFIELPIPPIPIFDEDIASVEQRARKMVGKIRCQRDFQLAHPLVSKLLAHDEERRQQFIKWKSAYYAPKYDSGVERRRLLIVNSLFLAATQLGCRPSMNTSKYLQDGRDERELSIKIGEQSVYFTIEPKKSERNDKKERLLLVLGTARDRSRAIKSWQDSNEDRLENSLSDVLVAMLVEAETAYRDGLVRHREWIIERKVAAEAELERRKQQKEQKERERQERLAAERIAQLTSEAKALDDANRIRSYVETVLSRADQIFVSGDDLSKWAAWARHEADRIDPVMNGTIARSIRAQD